MPEIECPSFALEEESIYEFIIIIELNVSSKKLITPGYHLKLGLGVHGHKNYLHIKMFSL
jgi:hypothetical protein